MNDATRDTTIETRSAIAEPMPPLSGITGWRMYRRRWDAWHEGVFDAMEDAQRAYDRGERLPSDENGMFWAWAHDSFRCQGQRAAEEVTRELEIEEDKKDDQEGDEDDEGDEGAIWDGETWRELGQRSYAHGYAWALHVELRRLSFGRGGVRAEDRAAYRQARGVRAFSRKRPEATRADPDE